MTDTRNIDEEVIPLVLAVRSQVHKAVFDEITESVMKPKKDGTLVRCRNWVGRHEVVTSSCKEKYIGQPQILFDSDEDPVGIACCPISVAENGDYYIPSGSFPNNLIKVTAENMVSRRSCFAKFRNKSQWLKVLSALKGDQITSTLYQKTFQSNLSNHKRSCRNCFYKSLGYEHVYSTKKSETTSHEYEKKQIWDKFVQGVSLAVKESFETIAPSINDSIISDIDCSAWRTGTWDELKNKSFQDEEPTIDSDMDTRQDRLFLNNASRKAYISLTGYEPFENESILSIAKADAWFTTCVVLINTPDGKGGKRNSLFQEIFSKLLPRAVMNLLKGLRSLVESVHPSELEILPKEDFVPSTEYSDEDSYAFQVHSRMATNIVYLPSKEVLYLYIEKLWFEDNVCSWIPVVDAYIGKATEHDTCFKEISQDNSPVVRGMTETIDDDVVAQRNQNFDRNENNAADSIDGAVMTDNEVLLSNQHDAHDETVAPMTVPSLNINSSSTSKGKRVSSGAHRGRAKRHKVSSSGSGKRASLRTIPRHSNQSGDESGIQIQDRYDSDVDDEPDSEYEKGPSAVVSSLFNDISDGEVIYDYEDYSDG